MNDGLHIGDAGVAGRCLAGQLSDLGSGHSVVIDLKVCNRAVETAAGSPVITGRRRIVLGIVVADEQLVNCTDDIVLHHAGGDHLAVHIQLHCVGGLVIGGGVHIPVVLFRHGSGGLDLLRGLVGGLTDVDLYLQLAINVGVVIVTVIGLNNTQRTGIGCVQTAEHHAGAVFCAGIGPEVHGIAALDDAVEPIGVGLIQLHKGGELIVIAIEHHCAGGISVLILAEGGSGSSGILLVDTAVGDHIAADAGLIQSKAEDRGLAVGDGQFHSADTGQILGDNAAVLCA